MSPLARQDAARKLLRMNLSVHAGMDALRKEIWMNAGQQQSLSLKDLRTEMQHLDQQCMLLAACKLRTCWQFGDVSGTDGSRERR